ncbi:esterase-like activity of phytase family protein [Sphingobium sp. AN641]|uniref:esterase-like activity of phytase family protein n=1 Tax=Sphingobium sp. AN641 TaxID=3133443 RepID=UPI0030BF6229
MRRVLTILALAVALLPAPDKHKPLAVRPGTLLVAARPLPLRASGPALRRVGALTYLGGWELRSDNRAFGGLSALLVDSGDRVMALSDSGMLMGFGLRQGDLRRAFIAPLPIRPDERDKQWWWWDSESLTHDPMTDRYWVGFELQQRICRYAPGFARVEACRVWPQVKAWPKTGSIESLVRLPDGRFLAIAEMAMTRQGAHQALLFPGDPAEASTAAPIPLGYVPPQGYRPTDAVALDERHVLVLNRRLTLSELFTATIAIVALPERPEAGDRLLTRTLARLAPPLLADNFEGIALGRESNGQRTLWIISDDNHEFFQRTLLLKFALDDDLIE